VLREESPVIVVSSFLLEPERVQEVEEEVSVGLLFFFFFFLFFSFFFFLLFSFFFSFFFFLFFLLVVQVFVARASPVEARPRSYFSSALARAQRRRE